MLNKKARQSLAAFVAVLMAVSASACAKPQETQKTGGAVKLAEGGVYPLQSDDTLSVWGELNVNLSTKVTNFGETDLAKQLEEKTGVKVEYIHPAQGQLAEQFNLMVASNELPDIIRYNWYNFGPQAAIDSGYILKLNDVMEDWAPNLTKLLAENPLYDRMVKTDEGSYYVFPFLRGSKEDCIYSGPIIRKDWLDKLNLEVPETIDEWETMLRAFKEQLNVDIPLSMGATNLQKIFVGAYGIDNTYFVNKEGKIEYGPAQPVYKEAITKLHQWYQDGLLDPNVANADNKTMETNVLNDRVGATFNSAASGIGKWITAKSAVDSGFNLVGAPYPVVNKGDRPMFSAREWEYNPASSYAISAKCKNPELAVRFMDYGYGEEGRRLYNFGTEGVSYNLVDGKPVFTDELQNAPEGFAVVSPMYVMGTYSGPFMQEPAVVEQTQAKPPQIREAVLAWAENDADKYSRPLLYLTKDEQSEMANIGSEISTYVLEMLLKFIVGSESLDHFDSYIGQLHSFNVDRAIEIYQNALDRYNRK